MSSSLLSPMLCIKTVEDVYIHYTYKVKSEEAEEVRESGKVLGTLSFFKNQQEVNNVYNLGWVPDKKKDKKREKKETEEEEEEEEEEEKKEDESKSLMGILRDSNKSCALSYSGPNFSSESDQARRIKEVGIIVHGFTVPFIGINTIRKELVEKEEEEDGKETEKESKITVSMMDGTTLPSLFFSNSEDVEQIWSELEEVFIVAEVEKNVYRFNTKSHRSIINPPNRLYSFVLVGEDNNVDDKSSIGNNSSSWGSWGSWGLWGLWGFCVRYLNPVKQLFPGFNQTPEQQEQQEPSTGSSTPVKPEDDPAPKQLELGVVNEKFLLWCINEFKTPTRKGYDISRILGPCVPLCGKPRALTKEFFASLFDSDGRMTLEGAVQLRESLFGGGADRELFPEADVEVRREAWKYMLGYYPRDSTPAERAAHDKRRRAMYGELNAQWKGIDQERMGYCKRFADSLSMIEKDEPRTDPSNPFFSPEMTRVLGEVLRTYAWFGLDNDYVQGMSDCCAIALGVMGGDEEATFWCFKEIMDHLLLNYRADEVGIQMQLAAILGILQCVDPELYEYMGSAAAAVEDGCPADITRNVFVIGTHKWFVTMYRREYRFEETKRLWEMFFSGVAGPRFHLFIHLAMIMAFRGPILEYNISCGRFTEILCLMKVKGIYPLEEIISVATRAYVKFCNVCNDKELLNYILGINDTINYSFITEYKKMKRK